MKNYFSLIAVFVISAFLLCTRILYTDLNEKLPIKVTTWDALGYYLYLPSTHIYHDDTSFKWFAAIDSTYQLSGGTFYQAQPHSNGHRVYKYLRGVSIMQAPFYFGAHLYAKFSNHYPADGFSLPYQYAIAYAALFYCILALFLLRMVLLRYFKDSVVALTLFGLILASNAIQYIAIEGGQSHAYIFAFYAFVLYTTIRWHETYKLGWMFLTGLIIGLATISRPTELIMLFIPLLWQLNDKTLWNEKWSILRKNTWQIPLCIIGGLIGILPQLMYWKRITGSWIYDVGSKWDFLNPHFRVLIGWEKGWFIYTPITIFFVLGFWFLKGKKFKTAVITFCLLNIYIIIAWHIWRYGGSYSTRALVQSYPVFALPLAGFIDYVWTKKLKWLFGLLCAYLIGLNTIQIYQYNKGILHYDEMNARYYAAIYLDHYPTALDMSLLDTDVHITDEYHYNQQTIFKQRAELKLSSNPILFHDTFKIQKNKQYHFVKINASINSYNHLWGQKLTVTAISNTDTNIQHFRLNHPLAKDNTVNQYSCFVKIPKTDTNIVLTISIPSSEYEGILSNLDLTYLFK